MWYTATYVHTPQGWQKDLAIEVDESGMITDMGVLPDGELAVTLKGLLVPGFVNAHCHLELSALKGAIPEGTGMAAFVQRLMAVRQTISEQETLEAIGQAMDEAHQKGILAFGDICNGPATIAAKRARPHIYTHSFIELLGLDGTKAGTILEKGKSLLDDFGQLTSSLTLHAPYSVSPELRTAIQHHEVGVYSFHLHESRQEIDLFAGKGGALWQFLRGIPIKSPFSFPPGDPVGYLLKNIPADQSMIWVHLAEISATRLASIAGYFKSAYACLCPRANQYIHQTIPDAAMIHRIMPNRICIGTDSLASNHSLDILEELRLLQEHFPALDLFTLLNWATVNGATALGIADQFGSFVPGTSPGLVHIPQENPDMLLPNISSELLIV